MPKLPLKIEVLTPSRPRHHRPARVHLHLVVLIIPSRAAALTPVAGNRHLPMATLRLAVHPLNQLHMPRRLSPVLLDASAGFAQGRISGGVGLGWVRILGHFGVLDGFLYGFLLFIL